MIVQVCPFNSPVIGVPLGRLMSTTGESSSTSTSVAPAEGVPPPLVGAPRTSIPTTPLTPASRVVQPLASTNLASTSGKLVTGILSVPSASTSFPHNAQSGHIGSSSFI